MKKLKLLGLVGLMLTGFSCGGALSGLLPCPSVPRFINSSIWVDTSKFASSIDKINVNGKDLVFFVYLGYIFPSIGVLDTCFNIKKDCVFLKVKLIEASEKNIDRDYLLSLESKKLSDNYKPQKLYVVLNDNSTLEVPSDPNFNIELGGYSGFNSKKNICISNKDLTKSEYVIIEFFDTKTQKNLLVKSHILL